MSSRSPARQHSHESRGELADMSHHARTHTRAHFEKCSSSPPARQVMCRRDTSTSLSFCLRPFCCTRFIASCVCATCRKGGGSCVCVGVCEFGLGRRDGERRRDGEWSVLKTQRMCVYKCMYTHIQMLVNTCIPGHPTYVCIQMHVYTHVQMHVNTCIPHTHKPQRTAH